MSGTYQLSTPGGGSNTLTLFPSNPLTKTPRLDRLATSGAGEPIFGAFFTWDFSWESLPRDDMSYFYSRYVAGGSYFGRLPHPVTGLLTSFTGITVESVDYSFNDIERDSWIDSLNVSLRVGLGATGGF